MAFKMKSGSPFQRNFGVGSSPMKTHNTGYDDQGRLIRLPDVTDREKKDHQSSVEMRSNLSEEELVQEKVTDKLIREDRQKTFEENQRKEESREYDKEITNKLVKSLRNKALENNPMLTPEELEKLENSYRKYTRDESTNFRINDRGPHTGTSEYLQMYLDAGGKEFKPRNPGPYGATEEEIRKLNE